MTKGGQSRKGGSKNGGSGGRKGKGLGKGAWIGIGVILILAGSYVTWGLITGKWLLWWEPVADDTPEVPLEADAVVFTIVGRDTGDELDAATASISGSDVSALNQTARDALQGTDFYVLGTNATGEGFEIDANLIYIVVVSCVGYCDQEFILVGTGTIVVSLLPVATNASILGISTTLLTNLRDDGVNTTANTTETDWTLVVQPLDDGGLANDSLGFTPFCNFLGGGIDLADFETYTNQFLIQLEFNITADVNWITVGAVGGVDVTIENVTTSLWILVNAEVVGRQEISIVLDAGIGVDFVINNVYTRFGSPTGYTELGVLA